MCRAIFIYLFQIRLFYYRADLLMFYFIKLATVIEPFYYLFIYAFFNAFFFLGYNIFVIFVSFRNIYFIIIIIVIFLISKFEFLYTYFI